MSIYALSKHLGHTSVKTTEIYLAFLTPEKADLAREFGTKAGTIGKAEKGTISGAPREI